MKSAASNCLARQAFLAGLNDAGEVPRDLLILADDALVTGGAGCFDQLQGRALLGEVLRQELRRGGEERARQARVGMLTRGLGRHTAIPVGQGLFRPVKANSSPCGAREWMVIWEVYDRALGIDLAGPFPCTTKRVIVKPGVVGCHFGRGVIQKALDDVLGHIEQ